MKKFLSSRFIAVYIVPGAVFQSVMIGGGYGTGREIVEYFTSYGSLGGLVGIAISFVMMAAVLAASFEFSRYFAVFDYRNFFKTLLGKGWFLFEILIVLQFLLILGVLASAAGNILRDHFGIPYGVGLVVMLVTVGFLTYFGRDFIAKVLTLWSLFLYIVFIAIFYAVFSTSWSEISAKLAVLEMSAGWWQSGLKYAMYNLAVLPLLLFVARNFKSRKEAVCSGIVASAIAIVPACFFHLAFLASYPAITEQPIPVYWLMSESGMTVLVVIYSIMLFGTFIETGAGMLQGINERIDAYMIEKRGTPLAGQHHAMLSVLAILLSSGLSLWGISSLIAKGYGTMAWGFLFVYIVPLLTFGIYRMYSHAKAASKDSV
ncbi:MAG: hypothetical protein RIA65_17200 [Woeseia sp.]